ncbi:MAG: hypothetical protein FJ295_21510 [Planctomycetes bacterium]|nr:hypothetical protein [Planctomycetota bacterium]
MNEVDKILNRLSEAARREAAPQVDVRTRVIETLSVRLRPAPLDFVPIAFAGAALAIAAVFLITMLPTWQAVTEPWVAYLP